jgi:hypothetical protein
MSGSPPRIANLLDDSLSTDLALAGRLDDAMTARFVLLARYAVETGADAILFTCSAFGPAIDAARAPMLHLHAGGHVMRPLCERVHQAA